MNLKKILLFLDFIKYLLLVLFGLLLVFRYFYNRFIRVKLTYKLIDPENMDLNFIILSFSLLNIFGKLLLLIGILILFIYLSMYFISIDSKYYIIKVTIDNFRFKLINLYYLPFEYLHKFLLNFNFYNYIIQILILIMLNLYTKFTFFFHKIIMFFCCFLPYLLVFLALLIDIIFFKQISLFFFMLIILIIPLYIKIALFLIKDFCLTHIKYLDLEYEFLDLKKLNSIYWILKGKVNNELISIKEQILLTSIFYSILEIEYYFTEIRKVFMYYIFLLFLQFLCLIIGFLLVYYKII